MCTLRVAPSSPLAVLSLALCTVLAHTRICAHLNSGWGSSADFWNFLCAVRFKVGPCAVVPTRLHLLDSQIFHRRGNLWALPGLPFPVLQQELSCPDLGHFWVTPLLFLISGNTYASCFPVSENCCFLDLSVFSIVPCGRVSLGSVSPSELELEVVRAGLLKNFPEAILSFTQLWDFPLACGTCGENVCMGCGMCVCVECV